MKKLASVNRFEVIDHTASARDGGGRILVKWIGETFEVDFDIQDDGKTLKIFLKDRV